MAGLYLYLRSIYYSENGGIIRNDNLAMASIYDNSSWWEITDDKNETGKKKVEVNVSNITSGGTVPLADVDSIPMMNTGVSYASTNKTNTAEGMLTIPPPQPLAKFADDTTVINSLTLVTNGSGGG